MESEGTSDADVERLLACELDELHSFHRTMFETIRVPLRHALVSNPPGGHVVVVGQHGGKLLYWSDIEEGWELEAPDERGAIRQRGANQYRLGHIMTQVFGVPPE